LTAHYRQAMTLIHRSEQMQATWDALEVEVERRGLPDRTLMALADATIGLRVRNATYRSAADIPSAMAGADLSLLVREGLLIANGEKRGRWYERSPVLVDIHRRLYRPLRVADPFDNLGLRLPGV